MALRELASAKAFAAHVILFFFSCQGQLSLWPLLMFQTSFPGVLPGAPGVCLPHGGHLPGVAETPSPCSPLIMYVPKCSTRGRCVAVIYCTIHFVLAFLFLPQCSHFENSYPYILLLFYNIIRIFWQLCKPANIFFSVMSLKLQQILYVTFMHGFMGNAQRQTSKTAKIFCCANLGFG